MHTCHHCVCNASKQIDPTNNPLRIDPTKTATVRRQFENDIAGRMATIKRNLVRLVATEDAFGLASNKRYEFLSKPEQIDAFAREIAKEIKANLVDPDGDPTASWWTRYIADGYNKGIKSALDHIKDPKLSARKRAFLEESFVNPASKETLAILLARVFTELKGIGEATATQLKRELADGLVQGMNPREIASRIAKNIDTIDKKRARVLARTEIIRAHAEGQLAAFEAMGVDQVGVLAEWSTSGYACELCSKLEGVVLTVKEAKGLIPRHPNCKCTWIPLLAEDVDKKTKIGKAAKAAIAASVIAEKPKNSKAGLPTLKRKSSWVGARKA